MNQLQTCPHCGAISRVAGLYNPTSKLDVAIPWLVPCWNCNTEFPPVEQTSWNTKPDPMFREARS